MSKETREALQKVWNFCEHHKNNADEAAEKTEDFNRQMMFTSNATCYWSVQQVIDVLLESEE